MKRDLTFNEYVDIFNTCDYSLYTQYKHIKKLFEKIFYICMLYVYVC